MIAKRISFQRTNRRSYEVNASDGTMKGVSLIQMGEAKGHGMYIDQQSLETALASLGSTLPAYVTHEGAAVSDRLLQEVGVFEEFYVEKGKLKAEKFFALPSFREDEPGRFRRLFDLAESMPDSFGLSLVFEGGLVWVANDGTETPVEEGQPKDSIREIPSVRFRSIQSADFVDAPAANEEGLFSIPNGEPIMSEENRTDEENVELKEDEENVELKEATEATKETEPIEDDHSKLTAELKELQAKVKELQSTVEELTAKLSDAADENQKLSRLVKGEDAIEEGDSDKTETPDILERFQASDGAETFNIWKQNKHEILARLRRN